MLGVWWKRANREGAIAGIVLGFVSGSAYLWYVATGGAPWIGIDRLRFGIIGMPVSLVAMVVVSLLTPAPDAETLKMIDEVRVPDRRHHPRPDPLIVWPAIVGGGRFSRPSFFCGHAKSTP